MPNSVTRPAICLNMIVRNEAHIVREVLDAVAPHISSWVIVDTGSDDGTQEVIRRHLAGLGIPGELHERAWRNFGVNRSEALTLAQGHGDYIWVIDADDIVVGTPDFIGLSADVYQLHYYRPTRGMSFWRRQLFRDGTGWRYEGVVHEYPACDDPFVEERLEGDYFVESRRLGDRNRDPLKYQRDRDLLLAEIECNPDDTRSVFYLAQTYYDLRDFLNAREWYARRIDLGGWGEEVFISMFGLAAALSDSGAPWPDVQDAYLQAWEFRPTRAEPLYALARRCRINRRHRLGYLFAARAAQIPFPDKDISFLSADVYTWRITDEQAICASWIGKREEAFALCRRLLARPDLPAEDRRRIAANRDLSAPALFDAAASYPETVTRSLVRGPRDTEVTVSLVVGPNRVAAEQTLNSFLRCCVDVSRAGRFLVVDSGLSDRDRALLLERYGFLELCDSGVGLGQIRDRIGGRFWLHLDEGWRFFAPESLITRLSAVLAAEPGVAQVGINFADAAELTGVVADEEAVRRAPDTGRYVVTDRVVTGPAMFDTGRLDRTGDTGLRTATLDEVLCIKSVLSGTGSN